MSLEAKLADALKIRSWCQPGQVLLDTLFVKNDIAMTGGRMVSGRQIIWLVFDYNSTERSLDIVYDTEALSKMKWFGDTLEQIHKFRTVWGHT